MKPKESKALLEVSEMKRTVYEETMHLSGAAYFRYIHEAAARIFPDIRHRIVRPHGVVSAARSEGLPPACVAESGPKYGKKDV
jgi:hypothetical protein